jgi:alkylation response protein AidB-like acyl-CoA dehydrogenase
MVVQQFTIGKCGDVDYSANLSGVRSPVGCHAAESVRRDVMEYRDSTEDRHFREEVREWLQANKPKDERPHDTAGSMAFDRAWQRAQFDGGWAGLAWPAEYGGRGLSPTQQVIWCQEYASAHCPGVHDSCWLGLNHAGPTLIACGSEAHKTLHLPKILKGEAAWCQGFSEPNAGSDLLSLRTRGEVDGDHLVVNGQKIWTSFGHQSEYQELLVRTGPPEGRHRGLTWIICDMRTPGIDIRPITALDGKHHNCEVFYDNVRIPLANVVGEIDGGWSVAMTTLGLERGPASFAAYCEIAVLLEDVIEQVRASGSSDGMIDYRLAMARAQLQALLGLVYQMASSAEKGIELGMEGSIMRLRVSELEQEVLRIAIDVLGPKALSRGRGAGDWVDIYFGAFGETIAGGTSEIQRNTIGERLLGLPR